MNSITDSTSVNSKNNFCYGNSPFEGDHWRRKFVFEMRCSVVEFVERMAKENDF